MYKNGKSFTTGHWSGPAVDNSYSAAERQSLAGALVTVVSVVTVVIVVGVLYLSVIVH